MLLMLLGTSFTSNCLKLARRFQKEVRNRIYGRINITVLDDIGVIESVKSVGNIISPVSGEITEINEDLADDAAAVNRSPYEEGMHTLRNSKT